MAAVFPAPSPVLATALEELRFAAIQPPENLEELRRIAALPRPWDPPSCPPTLREHLWRWLDAVAGWVNEDYTWRVDQIIPTCWPDHPHIAHELATVACLRHAAGYAATPEALEDWHRHTLPMFLDRIATRIGAGGCPPGRHQPSPGAARHSLYRTGEQRRARAARQDADLAGPNMAGSNPARSNVSGPVPARLSP